MRTLSEAQRHLRQSISATRWSAELKGVAATLIVDAVIFIVYLDRASVVGIDSAITLYPFYEFLGDQLRHGQLPLWNRHVFGGMPFIADPQSGWMYLPAMALFLITPLHVAIQSFIAFHLLLTGLATYTLARLIGLGWLAAVATVVAYQLSGGMVFRSACCTVELDVSAWLPVALVGVELAVRSRSTLAGVAASGLTGLALSQILAAWTGQGGYYTGLLIGGYLVYRVLPGQHSPVSSWHKRITRVMILGGVTGTFALGLSAAALLPRLAYVPVSSLANGYPWEGVQGGFSGTLGALSQLLGRSTSYVGATSFALAVMSLFLSRRRYSASFFTAAALVAFVLTFTEPTIVHRLFYLLPRFEELNRSQPQRALIVFFLAIAVLVGTAIESLSTRRIAHSPILPLLIPISLATIFVIRARNFSSAVPQSSVIAVLAVSAAVLAGSLVPIRSLRTVLPAFLLGLLLADLLPSNSAAIDRFIRSGGVAEVDLTSYYDAAPAAQFLQSLDNGAPFRFLGYDAAIRGKNDVLYRYSFGQDSTANLVVNNRAMLTSLEDVQGINDPIHIARFDDLFTVANRGPIDYHDAFFTAVGVNSPVIDLLNVRYIIVPVSIPPGRPDLLHLNQRMLTIYRDKQVRILENTDALPRVWIVHEARTVSAAESISMIARGDIDPRQVALVEIEAPHLTPSTTQNSDSAVISDRSNGSISIDTRTDVDSLLVLSEVVYPEWHAYVDGVRVSVLTVDHALRGVLIPAGQHTVEFRYESTRLNVGLVFSIISYLALIGIWIGAFLIWLRRRTDRTLTGSLSSMTNSDRHKIFTRASDPGVQ